MSRRLKKTNLFSKDLSSLLYAYGDVSQPLAQTSQCLDEIVSSYLVDICNDAYRTAQNSNRNKIKLDDFKFVIRNDPVKLSRADELISTNKLIIEAKKQFSENDNQSLKKFRSENDNANEQDIDDYDDDDDNDDGNDEEVGEEDEDEDDKQENNNSTSSNRISNTKDNKLNKTKPKKRAKNTIKSSPSKKQKNV